MIKSVKQFISKNDHTMTWIGFAAGLITTSLDVGTLGIILSMTPFSVGMWSLISKQYKR